MKTEFISNYYIEIKRYYFNKYLIYQKSELTTLFSIGYSFFGLFTLWINKDKNLPKFQITKKYPKIEAKEL